MIALPDFSFPDYPERDPRELRIHHMEQVLRRAAGLFRAMGSDTMARECEELLLPLSATHGPSH
jgi:hypothetical protein